MEEEGVIENAKHIGERVLGPGLHALKEKHEVIGDVRGMGVFWAVELVTDRKSKTPVPAADMAKLKADLTSAGLLPFMADNRIHVVPPAVVTEEEAKRGLEIIDAVLAATFKN
jgi:taurine--2-oxoglutarate transaminase